MVLLLIDGVDLDKIVNLMLVDEMTTPMRLAPGSGHGERNTFLRDMAADPAAHAHYLGAPSEFEDLFSDELWASVANVGWPRRDGREWTSADIARCRIEKFSKQWQQELNHATDRGPIGKPAIARAMAFSLRTADEIPEQLRTTFDALVALANA